MFLERKLTRIPSSTKCAWKSKTSPRKPAQRSTSVSATTQQTSTRSSASSSPSRTTAKPFSVTGTPTNPKTSTSSSASNSCPAQSDWSAAPHACSRVSGQPLRPRMWGATSLQICMCSGRPSSTRETTCTRVRDMWTRVLRL